MMNWQIDYTDDTSEKIEAARIEAPSGTALLIIYDAQGTPIKYISVWSLKSVHVISQEEQ